MTDPIRPTDDTARDLARDLLAQGRHGALGVIDPVGGAPVVSRVAVAMVAGAPTLLVSTLSQHASALLADPRCSLLIAGPAGKGDPLTHPRLTLQARAAPADKAAHRATWLHQHPKALAYIDFADFILLRLAVSGGFLNGGFGRAFRLTPADLGLPPDGPHPAGTAPPHPS